MPAIISDTTGSASRHPSIGLAPLDGITDLPFRLWIACAGCPDFFVTPFVRVTEGFGFRHVSRQFCPEVFALPGLFSVPVTPQLMGSSPVDVAQVAEPMLAKVPYVDINCGCPAPTVFRHGAGSALLRSPQAFGSFLEGLTSRLGHGRISVKMRTGVKDESLFDDFLDVLAGLAPALVTVHPRTQKEGYGGLSRWAQVERAARRLSLPVVGSGDVVDRATLCASLAVAPAAAGVMIGRGALRDPWIFLRLKRIDEVVVTGDTLAWALAVYALICLACELGDDFAFSAAEISREFKCETCAEVWQNLAAALSERLFGKTLSAALGCFGQRSLPRMKQLINFMDHPLLLPSKLTLLRAPSASDFLQVLFTECGVSPF